ncbi:MAG: c-type cytochrome, partial [candidate division Zixibacteria bacterium]|nr:c-type cytochrome [candidate division Zixibacteria bacterium]
LPNRYTVTWFEATRQGTYNLFCTEFCGKGHSEMIGAVKVVSNEDYLAWLEEGASLGSDLPPEEFGARLFVAKACNTCHKMDGSSSTGPSLNNIFGHSVPLEDGTETTVDENYLRESMLNPMSKVVAGYQPVMPTYQGLLRNHEIDALIAYIKSLNKGEEPTHE